MLLKIDRTLQLADYVHEKLQDLSSGFHIPSRKQLSQIFDVLFYASLHTEEGEAIKVTVTIYSDIQAAEPRRRATNRWRLVKFKQQSLFNIRSVTKLAKAADPQSTSLAISVNPSGDLVIIGLIDQEIHLQNYLNFEISDKPESPGILQASITGVGKISVMKDYQLLASLDRHMLVKKNINVLHDGVVYDLLRGYFAPVAAQTIRFLDSNFSGRKGPWIKKTYNLMINTLSRIFIQIRNYHHGGAVLISNVSEFEEEHLDIKHEISYNRLATSALYFLKQEIRETAYSKEIKNIYESEQETIDLSLHNNYSLARIEKDKAVDELRGAIKFVASQSCVDGCILMDTRLRVRGFGTVIGKVTPPEKIYVSESVDAVERTLIEKSPDDFGTRHRSMFAYCYAHAGSLGFVISQDGDIRAVTRVKDKLVVWEDIKTQQFIDGLS